MPGTNLNSADNVTVGKPNILGAIFTAPKGTTLPTTATATLNSAFDCMGYISEDGLKQEITRNSETIKDWGGNTVKTPQTEYEEKFTFTALEMLKKEVLKVMYGDSNVTETTTLRTITANADELPERVWVFDMVMSNGKARRIVVPTARITSVGEVTYKNSEAVSSELEVTAVPDSSGNTSYTYDDISTSGGSGTS